MKVFAAVTLVVFLCCLEVALSYPRRAQFEEKTPFAERTPSAKTPGYAARAQQLQKYHLAAMARANGDDSAFAHQQSKFKNIFLTNSK